ncbi:hypothetical protein [Sedimentibacter sp.]|uniref:hypothetical protein n=1 Tax=Sedimentibacter sp. TaxID=1960295 RepID=UPI0028AA029F|nr:hypothetical protein [Sedimentibacter sp.]
MPYYYVNNNPTLNPGYHHEVHTEEHANELNILSKKYLGFYSNCFDAVDKAKETYSDADGCKTCCSLCHKG